MISDQNTEDRSESPDTKKAAVTEPKDDISIPVRNAVYLSAIREAEREYITALNAYDGAYDYEVKIDTLHDHAISARNRAESRLSQARKDKDQSIRDFRDVQKIDDTIKDVIAALDSHSK